MITADHCRTTCARRTNGGEMNGRIDLESARRIVGDVRRRQDVIDPVALTQQQPAHLARRVGSG